MKVLLFDPNLGGHHAQYASFIGQYLKNYGDEVIFSTWKADEYMRNLMQELEIPLVELASDNQRLFRSTRLGQEAHLYEALRRAFNMARRQHVDVFHNLYFERSELAVLVSTFRRALPFKFFGSMFWPYFSHLPRQQMPAVTRLYHRVNQWALERLMQERILDALFVHTCAIREQLIKGYRISPDKVIVIPDPVPELALPPKQETRRQLGIPEDARVLAFLGELRHDKGPDLLLEALPQLDTEWWSIIAGSPKDVTIKDIVHCKKQLPFPDKLIADLAFISDERLGQYLAVADVVILPYRTSFRGTSGILNHAAAAGKPLIATDVGEIGRLVRQHGLGIVIEPESPRSIIDGLSSIACSDSIFIEGIEHAAQQYAQDNSWQIMTQRVRKAYLL